MISTSQSQLLHKRLDWLKGGLNKHVYVSVVPYTVSASNHGYVIKFIMPTFVNANTHEQQVEKVATDRIEIKAIRFVGGCIPPNPSGFSNTRSIPHFITLFQTDNTISSKYVYPGVRIPWLIPRYENVYPIHLIPNVAEDNPVDTPISKESNNMLKLLDQFRKTTNLEGVSGPYPQTPEFNFIVPVNMIVEVPNTNPGASWNLNNAVGQIPHLFYHHSKYCLVNNANTMVSWTFWYTIEIIYSDIGENLIIVP